MKTIRLKRTYKRYPAYKKKARTAFVRKSIPRPLYPPMSQNFNVAVKNSQQANYTVTASTFSSFSIDCGSLTGLSSVLPPYVTKMMSIYSSCRIRKVYVDVKFQNLSSPSTADGFDVASGVISNADYTALGTLNQDIMDKVRSMPGGQTGFMSSNGGSGQAHFTRMVDLDRWATSVPECCTTTSVNSATTLSYVISAPAAADLTKAPAVIFVYTPTVGTTGFQVIRTLTYYVTFAGPHLS